MWSEKEYFIYLTRVFWYGLNKKVENSYITQSPDTGRAEGDNPVNNKHLYNIYTMLDQRRRRWDDVV